MKKKYFVTFLTVLLLIPSMLYTIEDIQTNVKSFQAISRIQLPDKYLQLELTASPKIQLQLQNLRENLASKRIKTMGDKISFSVGYTSALNYSLQQLGGIKVPTNLSVFLNKSTKIMPNIQSPMGATCSQKRTFSWKSQGKVSPVKNQGGCGSCWAFGTIAPFESSYAIINNLIIDSSEQELLSCSGKGSCRGGWFAFDYLKNKGVSKESDYPYSAKDDPCRNKPKVYKAKSWGSVTNNITKIKQALCKYGALGTTVTVTPAFQAYTSGIFNENSSNRVNHAVTIVGWDDNKGAWLIKNSWSKNWGIDGYMWIRYNSNKIGSHTYWVVAKKTSSYIQVSGVGWEGHGAGNDVTNLNSNSRPDMILMAYDNPSKGNSFRYRVGLDMDVNGKAKRWSKHIQVSGVGWEGQGAGVAIKNIDRNSRPDMVFMAYDNPHKSNSFRYKIGWNLNTQGIAKSWSKPVQVSGVGWEGQGAGVDIANIDRNPRPDMVLMAYDNPHKSNSFRYKIGWNLNTQGIAKSWSKAIQISGVGWEGQGAGIEITNLDRNPRPDMILMAYDNPNKSNTFRYKIGWNLNSQGVAQRWSRYKTVSGVGWEGQGAGIIAIDLNGDGKKEKIFMAYDSRKKSNVFRYRVVK